ncbi:Putative ribonuclease H protein At1g65750, partial [Linum grandiflorum]
RVDAPISWTSAPPPFITLNTDGSVLATSRKATAGGVLHDSLGNGIAAFSSSLGNCSITRAELTGVIEGMETAGRLGVRHLEVQCDSACAVHFLSQPTIGEHQHTTLVYKQLLERQWVVRIKHIYREGNHVADTLANIGHELALGTHSIPLATPTLQQWFTYDRVGGFETRRIVTR